MFCPQDFKDSYNVTDINLTFPIVNETVEERIHDVVRFYSYNVVLPIIFLFGIAGNSMNIIIFTRGRFRHALDEIEKSAATGLVSLAVSDLAFCVVGLPAPFLSMPYYQTHERTVDVIALYYEANKAPTMNIFMFSSTWLVVAVALERYFAVCYPFHARWLIRINRTVAIDVGIYLVAVLFNIPGFLKYTIETLDCLDGTRIHVLRPTQYMTLQHDYRIAWAVLGTFLPLIILIVCNVRLLIEIYRSRARSMSDGEPPRYSTSKITFILVSIVMLYVILVSPSMLLSFLRLIPATDSEGHSPQSRAALYRYQIATVLANVAQGVNFAINFLLYCAMSRPFRDHLTGQVCKRTNSRTSTDTNHRYQLVEVHI